MKNVTRKDIAENLGVSIPLEANNIYAKTKS